MNLPTYEHLKNYRSLNSLKRDIIKNGIPDLIKHKGILYTQDYYDSQGKEVTFGNVRNSCTLKLLTENRYKSLRDLEIEGENYLVEVNGFIYVD
jgi:hypothetical protein